MNFRSPFRSTSSGMLITAVRACQALSFRLWGGGALLRPKPSQGRVRFPIRFLLLCYFRGTRTIRILADTTNNAQATVGGRSVRFCEN